MPVVATAGKSQASSADPYHFLSNGLASVVKLDTKVLDLYSFLEKYPKINKGTTDNIADAKLEFASEKN